VTIVSYVLKRRVSDVASSTKRAQELGAKVIKEKTEVPGMGWFSVVVDPQGAPFAMWETKKK
jgi:predicted enzyme related to lactoylglutathione lyase